MDFKCIMGRTRIVLLIWGWAFKIPNFLVWKMFLRGLQGNMLEADNAKRPSVYLAPMVFSVAGGWLNVMVRADQIFTEDKDPALVGYFESLLTSYQSGKGHARSDLDCIEVYEPANYGFYKGNVMCIDYGSERNIDFNTFLIEELIKTVHIKQTTP